MFGNSIKNNYVYSRKCYGPLRGVIFDWSGTTIDKYSIAPVEAFCKLFYYFGIKITPDEARKPMGLKKDEHIRMTLKNPSVSDRWYSHYNKYPNEKDVKNLYSKFVPLQKDIIKDYCYVIPGTQKTINDLKKDYKLKIGLTTGFTSDISNVILNEVNNYGLLFDSIVSGDDVKNGNRPNPFMIYKNMENLNISPPECIVKVDDTTNGIEEGLEAGCWTVGVSRYSTYMNIDNHRHESKLGNKSILEKNEISKNILRRSCAHYVVNDINEIPYVVKDINYRLSKGEKP